MRMNKTKQTILNRYQFAWVNKLIQSKKFKIQLIDSHEPKGNSERYQGRLRRFLVRLRSD